MLIELKSKYPLENLISDSRIKDTSPLELSQIHIKFGMFLGLEILGIQEKRKVKKAASQNGEQQEFVYYNDSNFAIIGILRAGLYIAEGIRQIFPNAAFYPIKEVGDLDSESIKNIKTKRLIIADSVINTGKSIKDFLAKTQAQQIYIATNVIYKPTIDSIINNCDGLFTIRISENSYKGIGSNDTGNRFFGIT
ncbi:hypothetical protein BKN38_02590 [Helicobacter sp. CLO-3]|uniref:uracil phosphoribosyltransferase n=1 Tax=unclassified Helicobacter TaxID=2593540 RepID=UPI000804A0B4|nr:MULTISPECIES: uracil phosphoribosyltransferase [unclassified Helicobacter]OBV29415.1 hypothetical protein BA723_00445 [Helicobacter sp. CLO-3]OHU84689.1 hypothetical protein BKN38_02590 [Helicobacter sp. CLO-3]